MSLSTALAPMFARMLEFVPKMQKEERGVRQSRENEILPILKQQSGRWKAYVGAGAELNLFTRELAEEY